MNQSTLDEILTKHKKWLNGEPDGEKADLRGATLHGADLRGADLRFTDLYSVGLRDADLRGADLDHSCLPLWCGSLSTHFDDKQIIQFIYHVVKAGLYSKNTSEEVKQELSKLIDLANKFHRAEECGFIEKDES